MLTFNEEVVESQDESKGGHERNNRIKDGVRQYAINDLVYILVQALANYSFFEEDTVNELFQVLAQLIDWNALELFGASIELIRSFLEMQSFRKNALRCLSAIVQKGMEYPVKVELIVNMQFMDILASFELKYRDRDDSGD